MPKTEQLLGDSGYLAHSQRCFQQLKVRHDRQHLFGGPVGEHGALAPLSALAVLLRVWWKPALLLRPRHRRRQGAVLDFLQPNEGSIGAYDSQFSVFGDALLMQCELNTARMLSFTLKVL